MKLVNLSIRARLIFVIGFLSLLAVLTGTLGLTSLSKTNDALRSVYETNVLTLGTLEHMGSMINANQILVAESYSGQVSDFPEDLSRVAERVERMKENIKEIDEIFAVYRSRELSEQELKLVAEFEQNRKDYGMQGLLPAVAALVGHDFQQVGELLMGPLQEFYPAVRASAESLIRLQLEMARLRYEAAQADYLLVRNASIAMILGGVVFASFIGIVVTRHISSRLSDAVRLAQSVAEGDLTRRIEVVSADETGLLMAAMRSMNSSLSAIVSQVREGTDVIRSSSRAIALSNTELAHRTDLQAKSLRQAAGSMEELTITVRTNAENAQAANQQVLESAEIARKGGRVVGQVVETMAAIKQSSSRISDIVGVIDSISFQTNLLALNAAVEAARAGDQGRGFAVVAAEVRNLAQRSAAAAKEIKQLIEDSVGRVDAGSKLVGEAGTTMEEIVRSVQSVTDIMREIALASQQQRAGIEQVNTSVNQMDQMTQQNAAMVEEAAVTADSLQQQAQQLAGSVSVFQLSTDAPPERQMIHAQHAEATALTWLPGH